MLNYTSPIKENKNYTDLVIKEIRPVMKLNLRGKKREFLSTVGETLNMILPTEANTSSTSDKLTSIWLGPDEWMIFSNNITEKDNNSYEIEEILYNNISKKSFGSVTDVTDQFVMINFINGVTNKAEFIINELKVTLYVGDSKKGFKHILEQHYCKGCKGEITTIDILNIADIVEKGIKLSKIGVSNTNLIVFKKIKGLEQHKLILKPIKNGNLVVTMYKIG